MIRKARVPSFGGLWLLFGAFRAAAQTPLGTGFTYQGELDSNGIPANGSYDVRFTLFSAASGGSSVAGPVCIDNVALSDGLFTVAVDFGGAAFDGDSRWLEIAVRADSVPGNCNSGGYTTLTPRQRLTASPYALLTRGIFVNATADFAGIGRRNPLGEGEVLGLFRDTTGSGFGGMYMQTNAGGQPYYGYAAGGNVDAYHYFNDATGQWRLWANADRLAVSSTTGNFGVGTVTPAARLDVSSNTALAGNNTAVFSAPSIGPNSSHIHYGTTGDWYIRSAASGGNVVIQDIGLSSQVMMGTSVPFSNYRLTVNGGIHVDGALDVITPDLTIPISGMSPGWGTSGTSTGADGIGVIGFAEVDDPATRAVYGQTISGKGVQGHARGTSGTNYGVYGSTASNTGYGVYCNGNFGVAGSKAFCIDHPLDPTNKYLRHFCTESPEPLNVYRGNVTLDENGEARITLPDYYAEINRDPTYQLTPIGASAPNLRVAQEIEGNRFRIAGGNPRQKVSWRVEAVRNDLWVRTYGAAAEIDKPPHERGRYQRPELYGQSAEQGVNQPECAQPASSR